MEILKNHTESLCPRCFSKLSAQIVNCDGCVYMVKECQEHGNFNILIEKDVEFYKKMIGQEAPSASHFDVLAISVTHGCDAHCSICYLPQRGPRNLTFEEIKAIVANFQGRIVLLSGGEPTTREDLPRIITHIIDAGKVPSLITNGLKLSNMDYAKTLRDAGLKLVLFSFNGLKDSVYERINGQKLFKYKMKALRNIRKLRMSPAVSMVLVKGINEAEVKKIYNFCLRNDSFIKSLRIRSAVHIGRHEGRERYCLSEMVQIMGRAMGVSEETLTEHAVSYTPYLDSVYRSHSCRLQKQNRFGNQEFYDTLKLDDFCKHPGPALMPCRVNFDVFTLLATELGIGLDGISFSKKLRVIRGFWRRLGLLTVIKMSFRKLLGRKRLLELVVGLRVWPDAETIDLEEIKKCASGYSSLEGCKQMPFCYALIMNQKKPII